MNYFSLAFLLTYDFSYRLVVISCLLKQSYFSLNVRLMFLVSFDYFTANLDLLFIPLWYFSLCLISFLLF